MNYVIQFQLNIIALLFLAILYVAIKIRSKVHSYGTKILEYSIILTSIALIVDPLTWILGKQMFFGAVFLAYLTNFLLFLLAPLIGAIMLSYIDYFIFREIKRIRKRLYYLHFALLTFVMLIINMIYPIYFSIDPTSNTFHTGDFSYIHMLIVTIMYIYMLLFLYAHRKKTFRYAINIFVYFLSLPIIGMIVQTINSRLNFAWTSIALGILVTHIFLESNSGEKDYLTKLYNRNSYEKYVLHLIDSSRPFSIGLIDLDGFKRINDEFGHLRGDQVLVSFSRVLEKSLSPNKLVFRLGGDEFVIIIENHLDFQSVKGQIDTNLLKSEDIGLTHVSYSIGWVDYESSMTIDELYILADKNMYKSKRKSQVSKNSRLEP